MNLPFPFRNLTHPRAWRAGMMRAGRGTHSTHSRTSSTPLQNLREVTLSQQGRRKWRFWLDCKLPGNFDKYERPRPRFSLTVIPPGPTGRGAWCIPTLKNTAGPHLYRLPYIVDPGITGNQCNHQAPFCFLLFVFCFFVKNTAWNTGKRRNRN